MDKYWPRKPKSLEFRYLGSKFTWDGRRQKEIKSRAKMGFNSKKKLLCSSLINLENRKMIEDICMEHNQIVNYGCETWTIGEAERKRLDVIEMWWYRRMLKIKWIDRIPNEEVLERIGERRTLWKSMRKRRAQMMGHTLRHRRLFGDILEGGGGEKEKGKAQFRISLPNN